MWASSAFVAALRAQLAMPMSSIPPVLFRRLTAAPAGAVYAPTSLAALERAVAASESSTAELPRRWERQRLAWMVHGDVNGAVVPSTQPPPAAAPVASASPVPAAAGGAEAETPAATPASATVEELAYRLADIKRQRVKRRRVRVNTASIRRVLTDPQRSDNLAFTRPLPLPQIVELLADVWAEEEGAAAPAVMGIAGSSGALPATTSTATHAAAASPTARSAGKGS
jgi:hypothetical protein